MTETTGFVTVRSLKNALWVEGYKSMNQPNGHVQNSNKRNLAVVTLLGIGALTLGFIVPTSSPAQGNSAGVTVEVRVRTAAGERRTVNLPQPDGTVWNNESGGLLGEERVAGWFCQPIGRTGGGNPSFEISCRHGGPASRGARAGLQVECATPQLRTGMLNLYPRPTPDHPAPSRAASIGFQCSNASR